MELTPENLDDMDCRPGPSKTRIKLSERLEKLLAEAEEGPKGSPGGCTPPRNLGHGPATATKKGGLASGAA